MKIVAQVINLRHGRQVAQVDNLRHNFLSGRWL
jgi:hypothetical protein